MNDLEKVRIILPHWIEHNIDHGREFAKWAKTLSAIGEKDLAALLKKAEAFLQDADAVLQEALSKAGGKMGDNGSHHHPHSHDH